MEGTREYTRPIARLSTKCFICHWGIVATAAASAFAACLSIAAAALLVFVAFWVLFAAGWMVVVVLSNRELNRQRRD